MNEELDNEFDDINEKEFEDMINKIMSTELFYEELKYF